jgi:hypothetical protein
MAAEDSRPAIAYSRQVSFDLAVFDYDSAPSVDAVGDRYCELGEERDESPTSGRIDAFIAECNLRWPEPPHEDIEATPWASWPLETQRSGGGLAVNVVWSKAEEMRGAFKEMAERHGLVLYDPQEDEVVVPARLCGSPQPPGILRRLRSLMKRA